jgi:hypothetical protein
LQSNRKVGRQTHSGDMTKFMPSNGEKLQWINDIPYSGDVPKSEDDDSHSDYLQIFDG